MQPIVISLKLDGALDVVRQIDPVIGRMYALANAQNALARPGSGAGGMNIVGAGSRSPRIKAPPIIRQPPDFQKRLTNFINSSRVNIGPNGVSVAPLIGQVAKLLGTGLALPVAIAATAIEAMAAAAGHAEQTLREFSAAQFISGGSAREQANLNNIGGAIGEDPQSIASRAKRFTESIATDPYAAGYFGNRGIRAIPGPYDPTDSADRFIQGIKAIRSDPDEERVKRVLRDLGQPELRRFRRDQMSDAAFNAITHGAGVPAGADNRLNNDLGASKSVAGSTLDRFNESQTFVGRKIEKFFIDAFNAVTGHPTAPAIGGIPGAPGAGTAADRLGDKMDSLSHSVDVNTRALKGLREVVGGASGANGAVPAGLHYQMLDQATRSHSIKLGQFNL